PLWVKTRSSEILLPWRMEKANRLDGKRPANKRRLPQEGKALAIAPDDSTLGGVVGRDFDVDLVAGKDADYPPAAHPARGTGHDLEASFDLHFERGIAEHLHHGPSHTDVVVFCHRYAGY